jgi:prolyl oligopeptidase
MFISFKKGMKLNGANPVYLYGYGGFNISEYPYFNISRTVLLENGFVFAVPNLRGGSEYGEKWHKGGMQLNKQNVFDDFIAAAEYLIKEKYTNPEKLAIGGGSNGALLVGSMANQRPDLFKAGFPSCGSMDMLRYQHFTIGAAWVPELGSSDDPVHFKNILKYSPLHNIREDIDYPALLVVTADHDDRVVPSHSYKYVASLQEKNRSENPVLIRVQMDGGHGAGMPLQKTIEEYTDMLSFMFYNLGEEPKY